MLKNLKNKLYGMTAGVIFATAPVCAFDRSPQYTPPEEDVLKHYYSLGVDHGAHLFHKPDVSLLKDESFAWKK